MGTPVPDVGEYWKIILDSVFYLLLISFDFSNYKLSLMILIYLLWQYK